MRIASCMSRARSERRGVVLLVVIAFLALFAGVALGFVFYAEAEAAAAQAGRQAHSNYAPDSDPELLLSYFLGQLIYDTNDPYSAIRGHSLARSLYGYHPAALNYLPFNGTGRLHTPVTLGGVSADNYVLLNYQQFPGDAARTPEFIGPNYVGGANPPWTAPDANSFFLARVNADGEVIAPSFLREWLPFNPLPAAPAVERSKTVFPHQNYHPNFYGWYDENVGVRNLVFSKGWRQVSGAYRNVDSFWMDVGYPVMTAPNGKKYKPLFAPLVLDLDGRLNMWYTGNSRGAGNAHVSNMGIGPAEISPGRVINPAELPTLYSQRFASGIPTVVSTPFNGRAGLYYSLLDYDGLNPTAAPATSSGQLVLPPAGSLQIFPSFPGGWDNVSGAELANHPHAANVTLPGITVPATAAPPSAAQMEAVLRYYGTGAPALSSDLFRWLPSTLANPRSRNQLTFMSWHFDRVQGVPYLTTAPLTYRYDAALRAGVLTAVPTPVNPAAPRAPTAQDDYNTQYRLELARRLKIDLNRPLRNYPPIFDADQGVIDYNDMAPGGAVAQYGNALKDRTDFAKDLYKALVSVTGAQDPNLVPLDLNDADQKAAFDAARCLAQLAVNIVDYIDVDDYMTAFPWFQPDLSDPTSWEWVYGTELPRLVLNEVHAQYDNNARNKGFQDPDATKWIAQDPLAGDANQETPYKLNVWAELHNPFKPTPGTDINVYPRDFGRARLRNDKADGTQLSAIYEVVLTNGTMPDPALAAPGNATGISVPALVLNTMSTWGNTAVQKFVEPANGAFNDASKTNKGFYVLGANTTVPGNPAQNYFLPGRFPGFSTTYTHDTMSKGYLINGFGARPQRVTVLLRRLAVPHLPANPTPGTPLYNPYITVDYVQGVPIHDNLAYAPGRVDPAPDFTKFVSYGRRQPFAAAALIPQNPVPVVAGQPLHTFFRQNSQAGLNAMTGAPPDLSAGDPTLDTPFEWLVHLDRPVVNPLELLHVSGYRPHELTQQFIVGGVRHMHRAHWLNERTLLYRFLGLVGTPSALAGLYPGSRQPGRVNLHTMDLETFRALVSRQPESPYDDPYVDQVYQNLVRARHNRLDPADTLWMYPNSEGKPFRPFLTGYDSTPGGLADTLLREANNTAPAPATRFPSLFRVGPDTGHPYRQAALLQKIYNNLTTTSNVFGVWVTVGFFEVADDSVRPVRLGKEIGRDENRHIRHRFFAIVDRSELALFNTSLSSPVTAGTTQTAGVNAIGGTMPNRLPWSLQPGMLLEIDGGTTLAEVVVVKTVNGGAKTFTADFTRPHAAGASVVCRGNPGPWPGYSARLDRRVVPHFSVIE